MMILVTQNLLNSLLEYFSLKILEINEEKFWSILTIFNRNLIYLGTELLKILAHFTTETEEV